MASTPTHTLRGRGAQMNSHNPYDAYHLVKEHWEGIDEEEDTSEKIRSTYTEVFPKTILNKVESTDLPLDWSLNPYQGCEHGCIYCYARTTHQYWGYSAGTDFEQKVLIKSNAAELLRKELSSGKWKPKPVMMSGNTDCYQPAESRFKITRQLLEVFLEFRHPVSIITKNALILRDLDILKQLNERKLIHVNISFTTMNEETRRVMEPRTSSVKSKLKTIKTLRDAGIPVKVLMAPIIPAINSHEIMELSEAVANAGASGINGHVVRLNGPIGMLFEDWLKHHFPDRANKVLNQIKKMHGGELGSSTPGKRLTGRGSFAGQIHDQLELARRKYFEAEVKPALNTADFIRRKKDQLLLF